MPLLPFFRGALRTLHGSQEEAVKDLTDAQLHWRPGGTANHIGFSLWHHVRTEDNLTRFVFQRRPTVWMEGGWDKRFGLDSRAQGTGFTDEQAAAIRISSLPDFLTFAHQVWAETDAYLATLSEADLERKVLVRPLGENTIQHFLTITYLTHGYSHLGEMWVLRGLQGLKGTPL